MTTGYSGLGAVLKFKFGEMVDYDKVANITSVEAPEMTRDLIDVSSGDCEVFRNFVGGLIDPGDLSFEGNLTSAEAANFMLDAMSVETILVSIEFTKANVKVEFTGVVTNYRPAASSFDDKMTFNGSIKAAGEITIDVIS